MKCAEVIEWMHRYLDHDLNREEITEMFRHIDHCLPCAEIFDRLTQLSQQLEQLPDVKPPFSIVDSILPRLDALDRGLPESDVMESAGSVVVPFSREAVSRKRPKGSSVAKRTGIGAVAAAIILGIAIFNMPEQIPGAQVDEMLSQNTGNDAGGSGNDVAQKMNVDTGFSEFSTADSGLEENGQADENSIFEVGIAESAEPTTNDMESDVTPTPANSVLPAALNTPAPENTKKTTPKKDVKKAATPTPDIKDSELRSMISSSDEPDIMRDNSDTVAGPDVSALQIPQQEDAPLTNEQGIMGLLPPAESTEELSWTSSNGQYTAVVEGQQLVIYSIPPKGVGLNRQRLTSLPLAGKWVSGEWTSDSQQFKYVTDNEGAVVERVYVIPVRESASPSTTPSVTPSATK